MGREVERKYLVKNDQWRREADRGIEYRQGYLCLDPRRNVRVRRLVTRSVAAI
jgi:adenylate cyclase